MAYVKNYQIYLAISRDISKWLCVTQDSQFMDTIPKRKCTIKSQESDLKIRCLLIYKKLDKKLIPNLQRAFKSLLDVKSKEDVRHNQNYQYISFLFFYDYFTLTSQTYLFEISCRFQLIIISTVSYTLFDNCQPPNLLSLMHCLSQIYKYFVRYISFLYDPNL